MKAFQQHLAFKRRLVLNFALPRLFAAIFTAQFQDFIDSPTRGWLFRFGALVVVVGMLTYHVVWFFLRVIKRRKRQDH